MKPIILKVLIGLSLISTGAMTIAGVMGFVAMHISWGTLPFPVDWYWLSLGGIQLFLALLLYFLPVSMEEKAS